MQKIQNKQPWCLTLMFSLHQYFSDCNVNVFPFGFVKIQILTWHYWSGTEILHF